MSEPGPEFNQSFIPQNSFTDTSPETQELLGDITNIIAGKQQSSLSTNMQKSAIQAGIDARTSKTLEGEQEIYKRHLKNASKIGKSNAPMTSGDVIQWERLAKQTRNSK
tara:strand:- start:562 stop:888 length:327 start_codon:yes stop_codon:yes gene_type:complete